MFTGTVVIGGGAGVGAGSGTGGAGGTSASGATDSSLTFVVDCARGSDEDPRDDGVLPSVVGGAVMDIVGRPGVEIGVSSIGVGAGVALAAAALAAAAILGFFEFLSRSWR